MDLATVKAAVKAWEKSFKAEYSRNPTKEDIKADPTGIAEQYSLYRRLSKSSTSSSQHSQSHTQSSSHHASQRASSSTSTSTSTQPSRATPRTVAASEYPTTPTPPTRRSSGRIPQIDMEEDTEEVSLQAGPSLSSSTAMGAPSQTKSLKRTASKAALGSPAQPPSPASRLLTTPKKRPYTGPIHDPNPINPFAASPLRRSAMKNTETETAAQAGPSTSPFFHATSPMKLKELLQENSLRKVQERNGNSPVKEITPRTKARKRLTGEIDETPAKSRVRRKRGAGGAMESDTAAGPSGANGMNGSSAKAGLKEREVEDEAEKDDEFGPTPVKATRQQESFYSFFEQDDGSRASIPGLSRPSTSRTGSMVGRLLAAGGKGKQKATEGAQVTNGSSRDVVAASPDNNEGIFPDEPSLIEDDTEAQGSPVTEDEVLPIAANGANGRETQVRAKKTVTISDDEIDEWDPEASHVRHRIKIVPTRSRPTKQRWSEDDLDDQGAGSADEDQGDVDTEEDAETHAKVETTPPLGDATTQNHGDPTITSPPPLLSLLSLTSPNHRQGRYARLNELRYKALFNPSGSDAQRLKAFQKGQEAFQSGETEADDETADFDAVDYENDEDGKGGVADDDWESESDGWKRTGVEMDDDAW